MVDRRGLNAKRHADEKIRKALLAELEAMWDQVKGWDRVAVNNAIVELVPGIVAKYGAAYAEVAAQWFEALTGESAVVGDSWRAEQVRKSAQWALKPYLQGGVLEVAKERLSSSMVRHAAQAGRDTLDASVRATPGVLYARRLRGSSNCDFCVILASRGPVYGTARDAGRGNRYHDGCDCEAVPVRGQWVPDESSPMQARWEGEDPGYDFEKMYLEEYKPYWRPGLSMKQVVERRSDTRAAEPWGGVTWLEDLKDSQAPRPVWWDSAARRKTLVGHPGKRPGQWNGGHAYGQNIPGKTEFPARWTDYDIDLILAETWENPTAVRYDGDRRTVRRVIDGVLVEVSAFDSASGASGLEFRNYHAVGGRGVFFNHRRGGRSQKRIPRLTEEWKVIGNES
ncbi:EndoU domain-containing protein [Trueperella bernardiae]|uniref:EndoU domain-containing protein n=1 Tax=Trueperella bernardiae TaxID=59561 RepID=UPI0020444F94|nr:EndoU domain-containing protein [Trueperella bernardiae]MCM3907599.1 EndoU domain-containing protein [Trueperella bernardiae]